MMSSSVRRNTLTEYVWYLKDLPLPGVPKNRPGVFQVLPVSHNQVVGKGVETVIQSLALLEQFTGRKRYEDCRAAGGKPALNLNLVLTQGK